jgi:hypothetical protein
MRCKGKLRMIKKIIQAIKRYVRRIREKKNKFKPIVNSYIDGVEFSKKYGVKVF